MSPTCLGVMGMRVLDCLPALGELRYSNQFDVGEHLVRQVESVSVHVARLRRVDNKGFEPHGSIHHNLVLSPTVLWHQDLALDDRADCGG